MLVGKVKVGICTLLGRLMLVFFSASNWIVPSFLREIFDLFVLSKFRPSDFKSFLNSLGLFLSSLVLLQSKISFPLVQISAN